MKTLSIRNILAGISLTSALFIFQACYGTPQDTGADVMIEGRVLSGSSGQPVQGIKVRVHGTGQNVLSDTSGQFSFYTALSDTYRLIFEDADTNIAGHFLTKDTVVLPGNDQQNITNLEVLLQEKQ